MNRYANKKVVVTGAGGFIGRFLTEKLVDSGAKVTALIWHKAKESNNLTGDLPREKLGQVGIRYGDLKEYRALLEIIEGADVVFHLAASNSVPDSLAHPKEVIENNVTGTLNLLSAARECGSERVVITSTAGVYGPASGLPIAENHPTFPGSPYAASKLAAEEIALGFYHSYALPVVILRPFNTFGPGQSQGAVIPGIIQQALSGREIKLGRIDSTRDFNYVLNTVSGFTAAGAIKKIEGEIFNIASGSEHSLREVIGSIENILNKKLKIVSEDKRKRPGKSDAGRLRASIEKAQNLLHYKPEVTFFEGLKYTVDYYARRLK
ncbi:MAG: GDP-mannose 4,6-dehydratase [Candidatus Aminicenantes bacterium]|nr:GDP-mannose 4,6-dehydratase [Candidatus Aminicenantes bacterium]